MIKDPANFNVLTDDSERQRRLDLCTACEKKTTLNDVEICDACACPLSYVIKYKFKICPLLKWDV